MSGWMNRSILLCLLLSDLLDSLANRIEDGLSVNRQIRQKNEASEL